MVYKENWPIATLSMVTVIGLAVARMMESSDCHCLLGTIGSGMTGKPEQVAQGQAIHPPTEAHLPLTAGSKWLAAGLYSIYSSSGQFLPHYLFPPCFETGSHVIQAGIKIAKAEDDSEVLTFAAQGQG